MHMTQVEKNRRVLEVDHLMADLRRRTTTGGAIAIGAQIVRVGLQLANLSIMARLLPAQDFGLVAMATAVTVFVGLFTDLGLSAATVQRKEIGHETVNALFIVNVATGALVMLATMAAAPLAAWGFGDTRVTWIVIALAAQIPVAAAGVQHGAILQRGMRWGAIQWTAISAQFAGVLAGILIAWQTDLGYWALVAQNWSAVLLNTVLLWIVCPWRPGRTADWTGARSAIKFGLSLAGFNFVNFFHRQFDDVLIGSRWGAAELGFYTRAYEFLRIPLVLISSPVASAVVPALSRLQAHPERWRNAFLETFGAVLLVSSGLTAVLIATAKPLVALVLGPGWSLAAHIFELLAISMFAATPMNAMGWIYISLGRTSRMFVWSLLSTPLIVASFLIGLPFGATGVALSYSCTVCVLALPCLAFGTHGSPVRIAQLIRIAALPIALGAASALAGHAEQHAGAPPLQTFLIAGAISGGLYSAGAMALLIADPRYSAWRGRVRSLLGGA